MTPIDFAKAGGLALLILILNLALTTAAIFAYAQAFAPGQSPEFYSALAPRIAQWSAPIGGALLFFGAAYLFARRRSTRNAIAFALATFAVYLVVDASLGAAAGGPEALLTPTFALSMAVSLLGAVAGAWLAGRDRTGPAGAAIAP